MDAFKNHTTNPYTYCFTETKVSNPQQRLLKTRLWVFHRITRFLLLL